LTTSGDFYLAIDTRWLVNPGPATRSGAREANRAPLRPAPWQDLPTYQSGCWGEGVAECFELADVVDLGAFGPDPVVEELGTKIAGSGWWGSATMWSRWPRR